MHQRSPRRVRAQRTEPLGRLVRITWIMLIPPPHPPYTLAPDLPQPTPGQERALLRALVALSGLVPGVVVTGIRSTDTVHLMELDTASGTMLAVEPTD